MSAFESPFTIKPLATPVAQLHSSAPSAGDNAFVHEFSNGTDILHIFGEIDLASVEYLATSLESVAALGNPIVLNLEQCTYIDSSVLSALVRAQRRYGDRLWLVLPKTGTVYRVFTITSLHERFQLLDSADAFGPVAETA